MRSRSLTNSFFKFRGFLLCFVFLVLRNFALHMAKFVFTCFYPSWGCFPSSSVVKIHLPIQKTQETWVSPLGWKDTLEEEMTIHSSILAWKIPWTEELGRLQSIKSQRVGCNLVTKHALMHPSWGSQNLLPVWIYALQYLCSFYFYLFIYLAMLNILWDLSSLTINQTQP